MANPLSFPSLVQFVADLARRVTALERRRFQTGATNLDELDDGEVKYGHADGPQHGWVWTWDTTRSTRFGGLARFAPSVAGDIAVSEALASYTDDGAFDEISPFDWESPEFIVAPNSYQPVFVTVDVSVSDTFLGSVASGGAVGGGSFDVGFATPWKVEVIDTTNDVGGSTKTMGNGSGSCGCTFPIWLHNDTDTEAPLTITLQVSGVPTSFVSDGFDATVTVRAESVFQMAALTP